ncbi:TetR/AcrR family transcriptional regulator [Corticibacterium sp. UT-5YL-CI-8]|nr:TetR/AcrR family transcriptional regulator [Tianweitania sp. UT-5YL-CI-8]
MARTAGSDGNRTEAAIRDAAVELIARHGHEAVTMRQLAARVGVQPAALYRYFPTKEDLLFTLMHEHMQALIAAWRSACPNSDADSIAALTAFITNHIRFHLERRHATHVSNMELRSLSADRLETILSLRNTYETELRHILRQGADAGLFVIEDTALTAMAIIQMITGVIVWFRPDERLSVDEITQNYLAMTLRLTGAGASGSEKHVRQDAEFRAG